MLPDFGDLTERFVIEDRAGSGGMGDVYRATDTESGRSVALKVLRPSAGVPERRRFQREIAVIADLRHPNIVEYLTHGSLPDHRPFYAMEWLDGEDLSQRQRHTPLGMRDSVEVIRRSAAAMAAVHARGIVHRDLKLGNIFLVRGKGTAIKLIDFGVVKLPDQEFEEDRGSIIGTPHFMAPEQARGEIVDTRADVYSLGAALFRLVTGRTVFETEHVIALLGRLVLEDPPSPMSVRFDVPEALSKVIHQAISRNREERFENGGELARALARVGDLTNDPPATERSASAVRRAIPDIRREDPPEGETDKRQQKAIRRVVAAVVFRTNGRDMGEALEDELRETLGDDARIEALYGGQVVAVVGVERSVGDEAIRAARAALLVTRQMPQASAVIAVGHALSASAPFVGASARGGNLAGEALERAAKQLDAAAKGTVRVDSGVISALGGRFVLTEDKLGALLLREDPTGFGARLLLGRPTPTVGRDKEIALLTSAYNELLDEGTPRAALVIGAPGIGKSRLRAELVTRLESSPFPPEVLFARGDPMMQRSSLSAFGRAMRQVIGVHDGERERNQVDKVRAHMSFRLPKPLRFLTGFFGELVGVPFPDDNDEPLRAARANSQLMQSRMRMALEAFVRAQAEIVPQLMILEDAHWADETTLDVIDWLLGCPDVKFSVFVFARTEFEGRISTLWKNKNVTRLTLSPLSPLAADKLVVKALPQADHRLRTSLIERAGGNVLFLEELIRSTAEGSSELPVTVQALVQMRLDRLAAPLRETVRAASVLGQVFWTGAVSALIERDAESDLNDLQAAEIVTKHASSRVSDQTEWSFRQALVRDTAYQSILEDDRAPWHQVAGNWLETMGDADMGLLAKHADAGRDFERAAELYAGATKQAYTNGAHLETALELAERGLACGARGVVKAQLLLAAAQARIPLGKLNEGIQAGEEAAELAPRGSDMWAEAERLVAQALIEHGHSSEGDQRAMRALSHELAHSLSKAVRVSLLSVRVRGLVDLGKHAEALDVANEALALARQINAIRSLLEALDARLFALMQSGDPSDVVANGPQVIEMADQVGDIVKATRARINMASSMNTLGLWEESRVILDRALIDARDRQMRILEAFALHNLGMCEARLGQFDRGIRMQRDAYKIADDTHAARLRIHARAYEIIFVLWKVKAGSERRGATPADQREDLEHARALAQNVTDVARAVPVLAATASFVSAEVQLAIARTGDRAALETALVAAIDAHDKLLTMPVEEWEEATYLSLVEVYLLRGEHSSADRALESAFRAVERRYHQITRPEHRTHYLQRIPEVTRILQLSAGRLGRTLAPRSPAPLPPPSSPASSRGQARPIPPPRSSTPSVPMTFGLRPPESRGAPATVRNEPTAPMRTHEIADPETPIEDMTHDELDIVSEPPAAPSVHDKPTLPPPSERMSEPPTVNGDRPTLPPRGSLPPPSLPPPSVAPTSRPGAMPSRPSTHRMPPPPPTPKKR